MIQGITDIQPDETIIVLITDNTDDITVFQDVWSPVIDLTGIEIGITDGAGLGGGGDVVAIWLGDPNLSEPIDTAAYPDTAPFDGQSFDVELDTFSVVGNANNAVQTLALGGSDMNTPNIGSPGNQLPVPPAIGLVITEIFPGQEGDDLTADWFEIRNTGNQAWVSGVDPDLFYDDESAEPLDADPIQGITDIQPGETVLVLVTDNTADITVFEEVWSPVIDLTGIEIGFTDGAGLGGGGDAVTLWLGDPTSSQPIDMAAYPDTAPFDGQSFDVELDTFSVVGNANGAVQTVALGGDMMDVPNIGSPGNGLAVPPATGLVITEIFAGQVGDDLTPDWFEIRNTGNQAWVSGVDADLFYDDESADAGDADLIQGITDIQPGESVVILITDNTDDIMTFMEVWSPVIDLTNVEIGFTDGAGLGQGGDAVTLWIGDPATFEPIDTASYPDTGNFDGQSYDSDLEEFSVVGNANGAVQTIALGGSNMDTPNIGSPGDGLGIPGESGLEITEIFPGQEGEDLTTDWFEIKNTSDIAWVSGTDPDLYYDDESADPVDAVLIEGIADIQPGESVIVLITDNPDDATIFFDVWSPVIDLNGIEIGTADGSGLGGGGDAVTLWLGDPNNFQPIDTASYPDTAPFDGQSYDSELGAFSVVDNANNAVATQALGGDNMDVPNIGSPGNQLPVSTNEWNLNTAIEVYPNPTNGLIQLELLEAIQLDELRISNLNGQLLQSLNIESMDKLEVNLSNLPDGIYIIQLSGLEGIATRRIVKQ